MDDHQKEFCCKEKKLNECGDAQYAANPINKIFQNKNGVKFEKNQTPLRYIFKWSGVLNLTLKCKR